MHRRRLLAAALLMLLAPGCVAAPGPAAEPVRFVMRHLDTPAGERDPDLTARGRARALALADRLAGEAIAAVYVTDYKRTRQTAAPLAERLGLVPILYDPRDTPGLLARLRAEPGAVLVVGHSNTVPDLVQALGGPRPAPLAHEDFGDVWVVADGTATRFHLDR